MSIGKDLELYLLFVFCSPCPSASAQNDVNPVSSSVKLGVAVVVRSKEGYALMTQRHLSMKIFPGFWVVPGGHVDKGESLKEAAAREVSAFAALILVVYLTWILYLVYR